MPSASPSPGKRPSMHDRQSSTVSLSTSGRTVTAGAGASKQPRPRHVSRHSRNASSGKGLNTMPKKSMTAVYGDARNHKRSKSGTTTPSASPKATVEPNLKRNSSHVVLPKNRSHGNLNLRKNKSTNTLTALNRNLSRGTLNKLGAAPAQKAKQEEQQKQGVFDLGDNSDDDDEEEAEWEDSTASPELTRNNSKNTSKVSTPVRTHSPNGEAIQKQPEAQRLVPEKTSSPPEPTVLRPNTSEPNLQQHQHLPERPRADPPMLHQNGRGSRAPPAVSTANARSTLGQVGRVDSQRALNGARTSHTSVQTSNESRMTPQTPNTPGIGQSSSGSAGVSHFLPTDPSLPRRPSGAISSDDESVSDFMSTYKPQPSESPEKPRTTSHINKARLSTVPSRTQQKQELQRREIMRGPVGSAAGAGMGLSAGSSASIHSRSASKGRNAARGSMAGEYNVEKLVKQDYETAVKQLTIVRRFRNPILESLGRLRESRAIGGAKETGPTTGTKRPPSRHGRAPSGNNATATVNGTTTKPSTTNPSSPDDLHKHPTSNTTTATNTRINRQSTGSRVQFQLSRDVSTEDMGVLTTSQGSPEVNIGGVHGHLDGSEGLSLEEVLIRRMWETRVSEQVVA